jgi:tartrate-resistant acid phosphatase type 5
MFFHGATQMILSFLFSFFLWQATVPPDAAKQHLATVQQKLTQFTNSMIPELLETAKNDSDPAVRRAILTRLARVNSQLVREGLVWHATADPDPQIALLALDKLRQQQAQELGGLFEKRLALARAQKDEKALETLRAQHQKWVTFARGALVPEYLQIAPPVFKAIRPAKNIRVLAFGDFGEPRPEQKKVAAAAAMYHKKNHFDLGLTLGDNFVPSGVVGPEDPRWRGEWEELYGPEHIPIYASTGNHDWGYADSPLSEILYSRLSPSWHMPALYYTFTAGPVQFFALATQAWSETQAMWLDRELSRSSAKWKIVYGHHPIYSYGPHGPAADLQQSLLPLLKNRAHLYLFGHEHVVQDLKPEAGVHFMDAPAGGQAARPAKSGPLTIHSDSFHGFVTLDISRELIKVNFVDMDGKIRYQTEIK